MDASLITPKQRALLRASAASFERPTDRRWAVASWTFVALTAIAHLWFALRFPLAPDETYYWEWSRHIALGYYDQGPMIAWWIRASCWLLGETPLGIRLDIIVATLATQILTYLLARDLLGPRTAFWSLVCSSITVLALAGSFVATYDPLVVLFWTAAMYFAARALFFDARWAWLGVGVSTGVGLLSKHTMILFVPCLALAMHADSRRWLKRWEIWLAAVIACLIFAPNLWWQSQHQWMTFRHLFMLTSGANGHSFVRRFGDYVGSQAGVMTPILFVYLIAALARASRLPKHGRIDPAWFLFSMSAPVLLFFLAMAVKTKVQANWAICGWLTPPLLLAWWQDKRALEPVDGRRDRGLGITPGYGLALVSALFISLLVAWPEVRTALHLPFPSRWDQMNKLYGGPEIAYAADRVRLSMQAEGGGQPAVGAVTYDIASRLAFYMSGKPHTACLFVHTRLNSYVLWNKEGMPSPGQNMVVVDDRKIDDPQLAPFPALFERVIMEPSSVPIYRRGVYSEPVHEYHIYRCYGYRPDPLIETPHGG